MSNLVKQIEALQAKQHKIELFEELLTSISSANKDTTDPVMAEVLSELAVFVAHKKEAIETGTEVVYETLTKEDLVFLKELVVQMKNKASNPQPKVKPVPMPTYPVEEASTPVDIPADAINKQIEFRYKGKPCIGTLLHKTKNGVVIRMPNGGTVTIPREQIGL